jgi:hypothetical protein
MVKAFARRDAGRASKPDSVIVRRRSPGGLFQLEGDQGHRLLRIVDVALDRERVPAKGEAAQGLDVVDDDLEPRPTIGLLGPGDLGVGLGGDDPSHQRGTGDERTFECHPEPGAELLSLTDGAPDPLERRAQKDRLHDAIWLRLHMQPSGCV